MRQTSMTMRETLEITYKMIYLLTLNQIEWSERSKIVDTKSMTPKGYGPKATSSRELRMQPRDYQLQGLYWLSRPTPTGKILADDMVIRKEAWH